MMRVLVLELGRNLALGAHARARQNRSAQCSFFQGARALSTYRALSHNFPGIEVFMFLNFNSIRM